MKLSEKIYKHRKRSGKSQEALASQLGVSRQAVSKWETGEAEPDLRNLQQLARIFGVTVDALLEEAEDLPRPANQSAPPYPDWIDHLPKTLGRLLQRFGWLTGIYVAASGVPLLALGGIGYAITQAIVKSAQDSFAQFWNFGNQFGGAFDSMLGGASDPVPDFMTANPVSMLSVAMMIIGGVLIIGGVVIAILLRKYSQKHT